MRSKRCWFFFSLLRPRQGTRSCFGITACRAVASAFPRLLPDIWRQCAARRTRSKARTCVFISLYGAAAVRGSAGSGFTNLLCLRCRAFGFCKGASRFLRIAGSRAFFIRASWAARRAGDHVRLRGAVFGSASKSCFRKRRSSCAFHRAGDHGRFLTVGDNTGGITPGSADLRHDFLEFIVRIT